MKCKRCGGTIIHDLGDSLNGPRDYCFSCGREPEKRGEVPDNEGEDTMAYHLKPEKEEEVRALLKDYSIREIVAKTGVAFNTIARIRNENLTEEERAGLKKRANVKGRNKREFVKRPQNIPQNISFREKEKKMNEKEKICTKCGPPPKSITEFNKNAGRPDGYESRCRVCTAQHQRDYVAMKKKGTDGNGRKKRKVQKPESVRSLLIPLSRMPSPWMPNSSGR
jgi:hypothetical protein